MARLIYSTSCSLDGYIADEGGRFDWSVPSDEVHSFINDRMRGIGTHLYGRRLYEVMAFWHEVDLAELPPVQADFAEIWRRGDKVVYSTTLAEPTTPRTRIERRFDADEVRALVAASDADVLVGGATLAAEAFAAGLVDDVELYLVPEIVGGGTPALPHGVRQSLELADTRRFDNGTVLVAYRRA
ncbi:MAG TPA: dihydrofolate reductase family protein [Agromyces sp.]